MSAAKPIQIVGGGLAGLTLGIALRKKEIPVTVFESGNYPRHRVCGEFINGKGIEVLDLLGLKKKIFSAGAIPARSATFFLGKKQSPVRAFPVPAICLSRFVMDELLADEFQHLGGGLHVNFRWQRDFGEGVVRASGRRIDPFKTGPRWLGLKVHAKNVSPSADLEMHFLKNGYLGICRLSNGSVDVCGLFRRNGKNNLPRDILDVFRGNAGTALRERMAGAEFDKNSFCSIAGFSLIPRRACVRKEICIGDALTMIPPVTGNGMSLAFESAQLAVGPLVAFSRGEISWMSAQQQIARRCDNAFSARLRWASRLQQTMFSSSLRNILFALVSRSDWFWRMTFERTR
ncbi:MAG TPA: FAD-dependent monooxygenase [Verrucomicrobiae bacterium]|nr:FAD-dependent monooxygenase [Verrucomicrobiae bacterium]